MNEPSKRVIFVTDEYDIFKKLGGNREVRPNRVQAIVDSIRKVGWQPSIILCNEKMEVIDGQGRLYACRELGINIEYTIEPGIGFEECVAMNIKMKNWDIYDFIEAYASQGDENYQKLVEYNDKAESLTITETALCLSDAYSKNIDRPLRDQYYKIIDEPDNIACLEFMAKVKPLLTRVKGGSNYYFPVLCGLFKSKMIDEQRMLESIETNCLMMKGAYNFDAAITELQNVYNYRRRQTVYFRDNYLKMMEKKGAKYAI